MQEYKAACTFSLERSKGRRFSWKVIERLFRKSSVDNHILQFSSGQFSHSVMSDSLWPREFSRSFESFPLCLLLKWTDKSHNQNHLWDFSCCLPHNPSFSSLSSVQFSCSIVSDSLWPHESQHARPPCPSPTPGVHSDSRPSSQWCHPAISSSVVLLLLPPIPRSIRVFSNESTLRMRWPKYWSFSFNIIPSEEILGLISFRMDWLHLLAVQGTLKSLLQHHSSKACILQHSAFFTVQLSHPYMTTGKTIALTRQTFVGKVMSLLLKMLSRLVITFLPRSKRLLISLLVP